MLTTCSESKGRTCGDPLEQTARKSQGKQTKLTQTTVKLARHLKNLAIARKWLKSKINFQRLKLPEFTRI